MATAGALPHPHTPSPVSCPPSPDTPASAPPPVALDFETYYCSRSGCSVDALGHWAYCHHRDWEVTLVALYAPDLEYAGPAAGAPWDRLAGRLWLSHNRNFDRHAYERLVELGLVPAVAYAEWHDTADLAVYSHLPRALALAAAVRYDVLLDKDVRAGLDGLRWAELPPALQARVRAYALEDAAVCWLLWADLAAHWPGPERAASLHTGEIEFRGIPVDRARVEEDLGILTEARARIESRIPWLAAEDEQGRPVALRSRKALDRECLRAGVPPPASTALKSRDFLEWLDAYGARVPAVLELSRYRRLDRALSVYRALLARLRPDGRAAVGLKYMGADKTGRWSGTAGFNLQNLLKVPLYFDSGYGWLEPAPGGGRPAAAAFTVDIRAALTASPGRKLIIPDLSQIEPRVLNWLVGHDEFLALCAQGVSPYEAHARSAMRWSPPPGSRGLKHDAPALYALAKARVLALGYGAGWQKFIEMARGYLESEEQFLALFATPPAAADLDRFLAYLRRLAGSAGHRASRAALAAWPDLDAATRHIWVNAWLQVQDFRASNPRIKRLWDDLDAAFRRSFTGEGTYETALPSGRVLKYFDCSPAWGGSSRPGHRLAPPSRTYGGLLAENLVQATARDVFLHGLLNLERAGYRVLFHVHDEAVIDAPLDADPADCIRLLTTMPPWARTLPVASEAAESTHYQK